MKKFAVLMDNVVIFLYENPHSLGYTNPFLEVDITYLSIDVKEGYKYDPVTKIFTPGDPPEPEVPVEPVVNMDVLMRQILVNTEYLIAKSRIN